MAIVAAVALAVLLAAPLAAELPDGRPPIPELLDQHGNPGGPDTLSGEVGVVIVVSAKRLRRIKPWERALGESFDDLPVLRVADVPRTAPTEYEAVAKTLRKRLPPEVDVLIDLEGVWADAYLLDTQTPNVLVFGASGELIAQHAGMFKRPLFDALQADLEAALAD